MNLADNLQGRMLKKLTASPDYEGNAEAPGHKGAEFFVGGVLKAKARSPPERSRRNEH